ncbi:hypothetical protein ACHAW5_002675 [Stephanodiscus triporus]|uniref:Aminoglycoside phosphotransferase domain-containing protein n=1 Tax=Stephanodiscus triporus TaxID=2934178 RepID=A0ABD3N9E2_9STRA
MNRAEATRLARICLPRILRHESGRGIVVVGGDDCDDASAGSSPTISEGDVEFKSLCRLWAGMGHVYEVSIDVPGRRRRRFIVKRVTPPPRKRRDAGDQRKATSYAVEANFYEHLAPALIYDRGLTMPVPYHVEKNDDDDDDRVTICMSVLDGSPARRNLRDDDDGVQSVLSWLATLHASTWSSCVDLDDMIRRGLIQPVGSYWHLDTRPNEHASMSNRGWEGRLKLAARAIHERLRRDGMQCCVHGDAKDANMLFLDHDDDDEGGGGVGKVGMYDFQYCGRAPPSVDLAYFFCVAVGDTSDDYRGYTRRYHEQLVRKLENDMGRGGDHRARPPTLDELEDSVALALCDFQRFLCGWGRWGSDISSVVIRVLDRLDGGNALESEDAYRLAMMREYG